MDRPLRLGVIGLGRAFTLMLPTLVQHSGVRLAGCCDPRPEARGQFTLDFDAPAFDTVEALCAAPEMDAVYVASPHQFHVEHVQIAARHGKHVLVEKPMALTRDACRRMIEAAAEAGVQLLVGHSHSYDLPYLATRRLIDAGGFGTVRMITAFNFTDYLYRPRRPEELVTAEGGGAVFSQAPHHVEVARLLAGAPVATVRASIGAWDPARPTEGAYCAHLEFENGVFGSLTYSGYGHFDSDQWQDWIGEMGQARSPEGHGAARRVLATARNAEEEAALKNKRAYGPGWSASDICAASRPKAYNHFGQFIVSCEEADLRPTASGVEIFAHEARRTETLPPVGVPRGEVIDELIAAVSGRERALHTGEWAMHTLEVCLAILQSARAHAEVRLADARSVMA